MFFTFCGTGPADFCTQGVKSRSVGGASCIKPCTQCADVGTVSAYRNTVQIAFFDTIGDAFFAGHHTGQTRINAAF
ncbi:hypothetical protein [Cognataquiflexum aquatile]|uniref:hypothetical protein n=1 Tax=Cognataquiflexum aquatile TaxID=2249427 RepID=UPI0013008E31|nr:hypothetical protein [Cognataquiflexum aquatile]